MRPRFRTFLALGIPAVVVAAWGCGNSTGSSGCLGALSEIVIQVGDSLNPAANTFTTSSGSGGTRPVNGICFARGAGSSVTFRWGAGVGPHSVTPVTGNSWPIEIPAITAGPTGLTAVDQPGNVGIYRFYCSVHGSVNASGQVSGMSGEIVSE